MFKQNTNIESMLIIVNNPVSCNKLYSFSPQPGDTATVIVKDNNISINILLEQKIDDIWIGSVVGYEDDIEGISSAERLYKVREHEKFIQDNGLMPGSKISIGVDNIISLTR